MDVHLRGNPPLSYGVSKTSIPQENVTMHQLEQECLQFFESTIDSLEESINEDEQIQQTPVMPVLSSSPARPSSFKTRTANPRDYDIIDLVRPEPDLVPTKEVFFDPSMPDFQGLAGIPNSHEEFKPRHDPSEYNPPLPSGGRPSYCPPGCVPTPALIAQKIAENQGGTTANIGPSTLHHRKSLESDKSNSPAPEHGVKHGPPTSAKPSRFPANISVVHSSKEPNQSLANVNIHERQVQMLANLPGASQYLDQEEAQRAATPKEHNAPTRSVSFRDPTPGKSRMEALSKLGLRNRAQSGGESVLITPQSTTSEATAPDLPKDSDGIVSSPAAQRRGRPAASELKPDRKPDPLPVDFISSSMERTVHVKPPPVEEVPRSGYQPVQMESKRSSVTSPSEVASFDFNSYGGKTVVIKPSVSSKADPSPALDSPNGRAPPPRVGNNIYGGKSRVMSPRLPRNDLPDILSAHIDQGRGLPPPPPPPASIEANSYGGRTVTINPSAGSPAKTARAPPPSTAPKPLRHSSVNVQRPRAASPENRRKSTSSKAAAFRSQGITVQFSGKGAMDDSRRAALRKLGLMKETG